MTTRLVQAQINSRYVIQEKLGEGGMGAVYRAQDRLTGDTIALKRVTIASHQLDFASRASMGGNGNVRLALAQEFRTLSSLRHPHIISVLDYGFDANRQPYFTMDLLEGAQTLLDAGEKQPVETQVRLLIQVLQALAYLHRRGILHRDLKPANVLVNVQGQAQVLDFGLSAAVEHAKGVAGTLAYMAPEVVQSQPVSQASDIYSVGMMAYQLFTGRYPFNMRSPARLMAHIVALEPDVSAIENPELAVVVARLLAKDPAARYNDADAVIRDLSAAVAQQPPPESIAIRESFLQAAQFIGRETELAQLTDSLHNAMQGQGSTWLVGGESGVGKSRLVDELRTLALVDGALVLRGQAVEGGGLPYQLWRDVVRRLVLSTELNDLEAGVLREIVPDIGQLLGRDVPDAPELTGTAGQQRLVFAIADVFKRQKQPVVLIVEDLQWATESLTVLRHLNGIVQPLPLLIIGNYRNDERPDLPDELPQMQVMALSRLDEDCIAELSASMLGEGGRQPQVVELLQKETEGNVFFLVEVVRALAEEAGQLSNVGSMTLPESVFAGGIQRIVQRRLAKVPAELQTLSKLAAVLGREVDRAVLRQIVPSEQVEAWLITCANAAVLDVQDDRWRFAHDKLRESLVIDLSDNERPALHRQAAEAIETVYPDDRAYAIRLARHWHEAGNETKEGHYATIAGKHALNLSAYQDAIRLLSRVLVLTPEADFAGRAMWLVQLGHSYSSLSNFPMAVQHLDEGLNLARKSGSQREEVGALNQLSVIAWRQGDYAKAAQLAEQALPLAREIGDQAGAASSLNNRGIVEAMQGNYVTAQPFFEAALALRREISDNLGAGAILMNLGALTAMAGDLEKSQQYLIESLTLTREAGNRRLMAECLGNLGQLNERLGNDEEAQRYSEEGLVIYKNIGDRKGQARELINLGFLMFKSGNAADASRYYGSALAQAMPLGDLQNAVDSLAGIAGVRAVSGLHLAAAELAGLVLQHPATGADIKTSKIEPLLADLREKMPADELEAALERGKMLDLETVAAEVLALLEAEADDGQ